MHRCCLLLGTTDTREMFLTDVIGMLQKVNRSHPRLSLLWLDDRRETTVPRVCIRIDDPSAVDDLAQILRTYPAFAECLWIDEDRAWDVQVY